MSSDVLYIHVFIHCPPKQVYSFVRNPMNLPQWASGLGASISKDGQDWVAESPMGKIKIKFAPENAFGILDHDVTLPDGQTFANPMRVINCGEGSDLCFTLIRQPGMPDQAFQADAKTIEKDLNALKRILEA